MEGVGDTCNQNGPTNSAVHVNYLRTKHTHKQDDIEVVIGRDSSGGNLGLPGESH